MFQLPNLQNSYMYGPGDSTVPRQQCFSEPVGTLGFSDQLGEKGKKKRATVVPRRAGPIYVSLASSDQTFVHSTKYNA